MKTWKTALLAAVLLAAIAGFTGCIVPCIMPLFEEKEAVFDAALLGKWVSAEGGILKEETFEFSRVPDKNEYHIVNRNQDGRQATLVAWLGKVGDKPYLCAALDHSAMPENSIWFLCPRNILIFRVEQTAPELKLVMLDFNACKKLLTEKPAAVAHVMLKSTDGNGEDAMPLLTASTAELQKFIKEYADSAQLFPAKHTMRLIRMPCLPKIAKPQR